MVRSFMARRCRLHTQQISRRKNILKAPSCLDYDCQSEHELLCLFKRKFRRVFVIIFIQMMSLRIVGAIWCADSTALSDIFSWAYIVLSPFDLTQRFLWILSVNREMCSLLLRTSFRPFFLYCRNHHHWPWVLLHHFPGHFTVLLSNTDPIPRHDPRSRSLLLNNASSAAQKGPSTFVTLQIFVSPSSHPFKNISAQCFQGQTPAFQNIILVPYLRWVLVEKCNRFSIHF